MFRNNSSHKYKTPFMGPYEIIQLWTNGTGTLEMGDITDSLKIHRTNTYKS